LNVDICGYKMEIDLDLYSGLEIVKDGVAKTFIR
jgi:hypothetical protein